MADFHFLHAADIHLDSPLRGLSAYEGAPVERFRAATRAAVRALVDTAVDTGAAFVVIAGDLYDGDWPDFGTGLFLVRELHRLKQAGIPAVVLFGNHDAANRITRALPWPDTAHRFPADRPDTIRLEALRVALHGQSFATAAVTENLAAGYPPALPGWLNIGVLHTALEGHARHAAYAPCSLAQLAGHGYDYWALGHVHDHAILGREPWVVFPGVLQGRHMRETGPKGCVSVTVRDGRVTEVTPVVLDTVRWLVTEVDAENRADPEALGAACAEAVRATVTTEADGRPAAVRVRLRGTTPAHAALAADREALEADLRARLVDLPDLWLESVRLETRPPAGAVPAAASEAADRLAALLADADRDPALIEALEAVLRPLHDKLRGDLGRLDADPDAAEDLPLLAALRAGDTAALVRAVRPDVQGLGSGPGGDG
ncbi:metallophosphoesterase family protein [Roseospira visakhapatnamensis]|uniref:DNA repair exonuclease SbcCD nuclease subunit n=1 Tax=Roseospira visakhapatnamensis TaxID=390880 RepID=A0A7W6W922_9PROT|nr:DNA repair exonuclease [Roseospira visakhapatnamensis]MBB4265640.1 DNA repair exonuclease SbcCD nuclease subunit [Roseospira visakhapatnamensis]